MRNELVVCRICNKETTYIGRHVSTHGISQKDYYDRYINTGEDELCELNDCNNNCTFNGINEGYALFCSRSCSSKSKHINNPDIRKSIEGYVGSFLPKTTEKTFTSDKSRFITHSKNSTHDKSFMYIVIYNESFKVGVSKTKLTDKSYYSRTNKLGLPLICKDGYDMYYIKERLRKLNAHRFLLYVGELTQVAELEFQIKSEFQCITPEYYSLDKMDKIKEFIDLQLVLHTTKI